MNRLRKLRILTLILGLTGFSVAADTAPLSVEEIAPGVFVHNGVHDTMREANLGGIANIGFIVGDEAVAVIDTGGSVAQGRALLAAVRARTAKPIRYILNTHMHPDHWFGNAAFAGSGAQLIGHARLPAALGTRGAYYLETNRATLGEALAEEVSVRSPDLAVEEDVTLDLGDRPLTIRAWSVAHTDNDLTVFDIRTRTLFAGDLVFSGHLPVLDGSLRGWLESMDELARIDAARVVPGHGPVSMPWPQALAAQRGYLERLAADLRHAIDAGIPMARAVETAGRSERGRWRLFDLFNRRNATAGFAELEWE